MLPLRKMPCLDDRRSWIYHFFTPSGKAFKCRICLSTVTASGSTSNLKVHLKAHRAVWEKMEKVSKAEQTKAAAERICRDNSQLTIQSSILRIGDAQLLKIQREISLCKFLVDAGIAWEALKKKSWNDFCRINGLEPISDATMRTRVFPLLVELVYSKIRSMLSGVRVVATTSDGWSRNDLKMLSCTLSFIDKRKMELKTVAVGAIPMHGPTTATEISKHWELILAHILPQDTLVCSATTDGGQNMIAAAKSYLGNENHFWCFSHRLNLVINDVIAACDNGLFEVIHNLVSWIAKSSERRAAFKDSQESHGRPRRGLKHPVETRWATQIVMARRFVDVYEDVLTFAQQASYPGQLPTYADVAALSQILGVLEPLQSILIQSEAESVPTLCEVPSWVVQLHKIATIDEATDSATVRLWKTALLSSATNRFRDVFEPGSLPLCAAALHPKYGNLPWVNKDTKDAVWDRLYKEALILRGDSTPLGIQDHEIAGALQGLRSLFESPERDAISNQYPEALAFWAAYGKLHTTILDLATEFLAIPASSAASERLWSAATLTADRRPQLSEKNMEAMVVLKHFFAQGVDLESLAQELACLVASRQ
jgi:hypothetical protein